MGSCEQTVAVWDNAPPVLSCAKGATVCLTRTGSRELTPSEWVLSATDNCNPVSYKIRREVAACGSSETWSDVAFLCCADIGDSVVFDIRAYDIPLPAGEVKDTFGMGQFITCTVNTVVADTASLQCKAPQDTVLTCLESPLSVYGNFSQSCVVQEVLLENDFSDYDTLCGRGMVRRHYTVWEPGGDSTICTQNITVTGVASQLAIRFPDDLYVTDCASMGTPTNFGEPVIRNLGCSRIDVSVINMVDFPVPEGCFSIRREWLIRDRCFSPVGDEPLVQIPNPRTHIDQLHLVNFPELSHRPVHRRPGNQPLPKCCTQRNNLPISAAIGTPMLRDITTVKRFGWMMKKTFRNSATARPPRWFMEIVL